MPNFLYDLLNTPHGYQTFNEVVDRFIQTALNNQSKLRQIFDPMSMEALKLINPNVRPCFDIQPDTFVELFVEYDKPNMYIQHASKAVPPLVGLRKEVEIEKFNQNTHEDLFLQMLDEETKVFNQFIHSIFTKCETEKTLDEISDYNLLFVNKDYCEEDFGTITLFDTKLKFAKVDFLEPSEFFAVKNFYGHLAIQNSECIIDVDPSQFSSRQIIYVEMIGLVFGAKSVCKLIEPKLFETKRLNKFNFMMIGDD